MNRYRIYGFHLESTYRLRNFLASGTAPSDIRFEIVQKPLYDLAGLEPAYSSQLQNSNGESTHRLFLLDDHEVLRVAGVADFSVANDRIECRLAEGGQLLAMEAQLLGTVLAYWLERRGVHALHASAVEIGGFAIGFLAPRGTGKSALAAAMIQRQARLLTDDILPVLEPTESSGDVRSAFQALPGYPQFRMWPSEAESFHASLDELPLVHPGFSKRRVPVDRERFCCASSPIACLYLPARRTDGLESGVETETLSPGQAVIELVRHSFLPKLVAALGWEQRRLNSFVRLVERIPVRRLSYPDGLEHLPDTCSEIVIDLRKTLRSA